MPEASHAPESTSSLDLAARRHSAGVAAQDQACIGEFYEAWFDRSLSLARRITGRDEHFCLDVVQNAMLRVIRSMRPMPTHRDVDRWMTRVVHTAALDELRSLRRRSARERGATRDEANAHASPADAAEIDDTIADVMQRLDALDPVDRAAVTLRFGLGRTLSSIAATLGLSPDAQHGRIRRALAKLRGFSREDRS